MKRVGKAESREVTRAGRELMRLGEEVCQQKERRVYQVRGSGVVNGRGKIQR